jgi:RNA polymerase sigma-70 factor (ECF subfamily)
MDDSRRPRARSALSVTDPPEPTQYSPVSGTLDPVGVHFATVFRDHHDFVWRTLRHFGVDDAALDDATQDVFVVVHRRLDDFDGRAPLRSWLIGICRRVALRYRERSARRGDRLAVAAEDPAVAPGDPEQAAEASEAVELVEDFLTALDPDKRAVFRLCEIEGMSAPEVADALGVNLNTVYSRLRLARRRFEDTVRRHRARQARRTAWIA